MTGPMPASERGAPTPVTALQVAPAEVVDRLAAPTVPVPDAVVRRLAEVCAEVDTDPGRRCDSGRDWWPLAIHWAVRGQVPKRPVVVVRPTDADQVAGVLAVCHDARLPCTPTAGRSGVCGASVPVFGGVALDLCGLAGVADIDDASLLADVAAGTFGPDLEDTLGRRGLTLGHWPQSMALSTVGGWVACRSAGQYSTRYGKIEDMVVGLDVVLADGRKLRTGGAGPRSAVGPDVTGLFVGAEGTLGVVTSARLRLHPRPVDDVRTAWLFPTMAAGLEACRLVLRAGGTPAVLRLYDEAESARNFDVTDGCLLVVLDDAEPGLAAATARLVGDRASAAGGEPADGALVDRWLAHRNDVSALAPLVRAGVVVDTIEIAARWSALPGLYQACTEALRAVPGTLVASAHQSHAYPDGACLYFTFAGRPPNSGGRAAAAPATATAVGGQVGDGDVDDLDEVERYYLACWDAVLAEVVRAGAAISHHHGVGLNRARVMRDAPGVDLAVLTALKAALDPRGILNPGKLGLPSPFGEVLWP